MITSKELLDGCVPCGYRMSSIVLKKVVADAANPKKANIGRIYAKVKFNKTDEYEGMESPAKTKVFWAEVPVKGTDVDGNACIENQPAIDTFKRVWQTRAKLIADGEVDNAALLITGAEISVPVDAHYKLRNSVGPNGEPKGSRFKQKDEKGILIDKVYTDINVFILFDHSGNASRDPLKEALSILNNATNCTRVPQVNSAVTPTPIAPSTTPPVTPVADIPSEILGSAEDDSDII